MYKKIALAFLCLIMLFNLALADGNLISNSSFEDLDAQNMPKGFYTDAYKSSPSASKMGISKEKAHSGNYSAFIKNLSANDARFVYRLKVEPESMYKLSAYILAEGVEGGRGANVSVAGVYSFSNSLYDTQGKWEKVELYGLTGQNQRELEVFVRLGGYSGESKGKAYFDDISLEKIDDLPENAFLDNWYVEKTQPKVEKAPAQGANVPKMLGISAIYLMLFLLIITSIPQDTSNLANKDKRYSLAFALAIIASLGFRYIIAYSIYGHPIDMNCFSAWGAATHYHGISGFYASDIFCDYPPGYLYVLWLNELIKKIFNASNGIHWAIIKTLPILCDICIAIILYAISSKKYGNKLGFSLAALFAFNASGILISAAWGQVDSVFALLILICLMLLLKNKEQYAIPIYILSCLIKPHALIFGPAALAYIVLRYILINSQAKNKKDSLANYFKRLAIGLLLGIIVFGIVVIPFSIKIGNISWLINKYAQTLASYKYASVNTANLHYLLGGNWLPQESTLSTVFIAIYTMLILLSSSYIYIKKIKGNSFVANIKTLLKNNNLDVNQRKNASIICFALLGILYSISLLIMALIEPSHINFSTISIAFIFISVFALMFIRQDINRLAFYLAFIQLGIYCLGVRMHERYIYVAIVLFFMDFAINKGFSSLLIALLLSITSYLNCSIVLENSFVAAINGHLNADTLWLNSSIAIANIIILAFACFYLLYQKELFGINKKIKTDKDESINNKNYIAKDLLEINKESRLNKKDFLIILIVCALYSVAAFWALGSFKAPQKAFISSLNDEEVVLELEDSKEFNALVYGAINYNTIYLSTSEDGINFGQEYPFDLNQQQIFRWKYLTESTQSENGYTFSNRPLLLHGKYVKLRAEESGVYVNEIVLRSALADENGHKQIYTAKVVDHKGFDIDLKGDVNLLLDEQDTCPKEPGYFSGTYFDEVYHPRTAYEHIHGIKPYETSHPPLGKLIMALGVLIFGMTPFGFRLMGVVSGILMLPIMYASAKHLSKSSKIASFAMLMLALDCMHLTQTRIATIDSYPVLFIMMSYLFMIKYININHYSVPAKKYLINLLLCGISFGLAVASKWIGLYSGFGLAIIFFASLAKQIMQGKYAKENKLELIKLYPDKSSIIERASKGYVYHALEQIAYCIIFFIIIPIIIYYLSYIPYFAPSGGISIGKVINAQVGMYQYHSTPGLGADHPFQSPWWQWPLILKPMWYLVEHYEKAGFSSSIFCMGNPAVFYTSFIAIIASMIIFIIIWARGINSAKPRDNRALAVIVIGFLSQYLPWVLVPRSMFIYHYFSSVPFIILALSYMIYKISCKNKKLANLLAIAIIIVSLLMFIGFYPYASGVLTSNKWLDFMKWFPNIWY